MSIPVDFAILAPVPEEHLESGQEVAATHGSVAFGSRKWELFREIDRLRDGQPVPVLIYPSHEDTRGKLTFVIAWKAWYIKRVETGDGAHPDGMTFRPPTTAKYPEDNRGFWAVFWHVEHLERLPENETMPISTFDSYKTGYWRKNHPPLGPEIVARPSWF